MPIQVKRSVHVFVKVDASFKKSYVLFINKLISELKERLLTLTMSLKSASVDESYREFILSKRNDTRLQIDQLNQQINKIRECKSGERFKLSTLEGFSEINEGDAAMAAISPVMIEVVDEKVQRISV